MKSMKLSTVTAEDTVEKGRTRTRDCGLKQYMQFEIKAINTLQLHVMPTRIWLKGSR